MFRPNSHLSIFPGMNVLPTRDLQSGSLCLKNGIIGNLPAQTPQVRPLLKMRL
jgi:hypothetical protein